MQSLSDALRASNNPLAEFRKLTQAKPVVGPAPAATQCPPRNAPGSKAKPRRGKFVLYRDDWNPNIDTCGDHEAHNAVNSSRQRTDLEAIDLAWAIAGESRDRHGTEDAAHANRTQPSAAKILHWLRDSSPVIPATATAEVLAPTPAWKLKQRTSKNQRLLLRAVRLSQQGMPWDDVAKALGVARAEARRMRQRVVNLIGSEAIKRDLGFARKKRTADVV